MICEREGSTGRGGGPMAGGKGVREGTRRGVERRERVGGRQDVIELYMDAF